MNDITMIGHISRDIMIYKGDVVRLTGGPEEKKALILPSLLKTNSNESFSCLFVSPGRVFVRSRIWELRFEAAYSRNRNWN